MTRSAISALIVVLASPTAACGRKGAPLPPLVKLPAAPAELTAERRGDTVNVRFTVPRVNTDDSRPANVARVDIFAFTGPITVTDQELIAQGTRVATVVVKRPRDPNDTIDPGEPEDALAPLVGDGLDQGSVAGIREVLARSDERLAAPGAIARTYIGVGVTAKGRMGPVSARVVVPLAPPPAPPASASATYDERTITLTWQAVAGAGAITYHVYEVAPISAPGASGVRAPDESVAAETRLTEAPSNDTRYRDMRITWGLTRCYVVRAVLSVDALTVESDGAAPACVTLTDTFPPAAPTGLQAVAGGGTISLIWDANAERDLEGYIVLRAARPGDVLTAITPSPVRETTFRDAVPAGTAYVYAVAAADRAGNVSPLSNRVEETAR